ncbi:MAG: hypothetical protein FJ170_05620 [Gammaproteobacteria bacterium]|nr:hypothetical protein [Gammaproteobacteria bacterium]
MKTSTKISTLKVLALMLAATAAVFSVPARAALVQLCGQTVCYEYENNPLVNQGLLLVGGPRLLGNSNVLNFTPVVFNAMAFGPGGLEERTATFHFSRIWSPAGLEIAAISISDSGDYQVFNGGSVTAGLVLRSNDLVHDGQGPGYPESAVAAGGFGSSAPTGLPFQNWSYTASIDPAAAFADLATSVDLTIISTLRASTGAPGHAAFVARKLSLTTATTAAVPAPAGFWLLATGGLLLAGRIRRAGRKA